MLHGPRAVQVRGHAQDMDMAGADLDHKEHIQAAQGHRAVDMKEVACQHRPCLGVQELPPGIPAALRGGRYPQPPQHPPDRGRPDPVAQAERLALDPARLLPIQMPGASPAAASTATIHAPTRRRRFWGAGT